MARTKKKKDEKKVNTFRVVDDCPNCGKDSPCTMRVTARSGYGGCDTCGYGDDPTITISVYCKKCRTHVGGTYNDDGVGLDI